MTLIEVRNSDGLVGRCDARCYGAIGHKCTCICGGKNHAVGLVTAQGNTEHLAIEELTRAGKTLYGGNVEVTKKMPPAEGVTPVRS